MNRSPLSRSIQLALVGSSLLLAMPGLALAQSSPEEEEGTQTLDTVQVTGSRLKRAEIEGAAPVTVITRAQIDMSGDVSVADVMRDSTFASFGNFRPQSGSTAQSLATIDLRGVGSGRTLVLIDGRRAPTNPMAAGAGADLNSIPLAAVERIEILSDGASAVYGSDAIGGVVNVVLRKDFNGVEMRYGTGNPKVDGGDTEEMSVLFGTASETTTLMAGASYNERGMLFTRDQIGGDRLGVSSYGNNYLSPTTGLWTRLPGFACDSNNFYRITSGGQDLCSYDFNRVAANEANVENLSVFARGEHFINDDWSVFLNVASTRTESFGRYAPTPGQLVFAEGDPLDVVVGDGEDTIIRHRFAAAGTRDTFTDATNTDILVGAEGRLNDRFGVEFGLRRTDYKFIELGKGYIVRPLAEQAIRDGLYDLYDPFSASQDVLKSFTATISRDSRYTSEEAYALLTADLFEMGGGTSNAVFGFEVRSDDYQDLFDPLQEAGVIEGSAGNSSQGKRNQRAAYFEWLLPFHSEFEVSLAGRYDRYSDYGGDFSPKVSFRWSPIDTLTFRGSVGEGFRAPSLDILTQQPSFSAETVNDPQTCVAFGQPANCAIQVDTFGIANPDLASENSRQYALGGIWSPVDWFDFSLDYYRIQVENTIVQIDAQDIIDSDLDPVRFGPIPAGLGLVRNPTTGAITEITTGFANAGDLDTDGLDARFNTRFDLGGGRLDSELAVSWINKFEITSPAGVTTDQIDLPGNPELRGAFRNSWSKGDFAVTWNANHIGKNAEWSSYTTHDVQLSWNAPWNATFVVGATNVGDRYPELRNFDGRPFNFFLYDAYGRTPYIRYTQRF